jgi:tRNA(Ile2) C34 agmatinyltransferase TiaS
MKTFKKKARYAMFKFLTRIATAKYTPKLLVKAVDWLRIKFVRPELKMVQQQRQRVNPICPVCKEKMRAAKGMRVYSHKACRAYYRRVNYRADKREMREALKNNNGVA